MHMIYDLHTSVLIFLYIVSIFVIALVNQFLRLGKRRFLLLSVLSLYVLGLIKITVFPFTFEHFGWYDQIPYMSVQLVPFRTIQRLCYNHNYVQIFGNLLLLVPIPFFLYLFKKTMSRFRMALYSIGISLFIEMLQFLINVITKICNHVVDVDDLILNSLGSSLFILVFYNSFKFFDSLIDDILKKKK